MDWNTLFHMGDHQLASNHLKSLSADCTDSWNKGEKVTYGEMGRNIVLECNRPRSIFRHDRIQMNHTTAPDHCKVQIVDLFQLDDQNIRDQHD